MEKIAIILFDNIPWIFSGIGVFLLGLFITVKVSKKPANKQKQVVKNNSIGIQSGNNVILNGSNNSEKANSDIGEQ